MKALLLRGPKDGETINVSTVPYKGKAPNVIEYPGDVRYCKTHKFIEGARVFLFEKDFEKYQVL